MSEEITVVFAGDVFLGKSLNELVRTEGLEWLKRRLWEPVGDCDYVFYNLEAPVTDNLCERETKSWNLRSPRVVVEMLDKRFVASIANNHIMDFGCQGLSDTMGALAARQPSRAPACNSRVRPPW